jgi:hypothetical protein
MGSSDPEVVRGGLEARPRESHRRNVRQGRDRQEDDGDDKVVVRWAMAMTLSGAFLGIAPANKRVTVNRISSQHAVNRQISAGRDNRDQLRAGSARSRTGAQVSVRCLSYIRRFLVRIKYATSRYFSSYHHAVLS